MQYYVLPLLVYLLSIPMINLGYLLFLRLSLLTIMLIFYRKYYKFKLQFDILTVFIGIATFAAWVLLEGKYRMIGTSSWYIPTNNLLLFSRILTFVIIAPIIEEFFVRDFLARILVSSSWQKVRLGTFTTPSFVITTLFFGLSHSRWLPGIIAGVLFNYLIYKKKNMDSVVTAHMIANFLLVVYILHTGSWQFW